MQDIKSSKAAGIDKLSGRFLKDGPTSFAITDFCLVDTTEKQVLKIMQDIKSYKAAGIDKLSGRF